MLGSQSNDQPINPEMLVRDKLVFGGYYEPPMADPNWRLPLDMNVTANLQVKSVLSVSVATGLTMTGIVSDLYGWILVSKLTYAAGQACFPYVQH